MQLIDTEKMFYELDTKLFIMLQNVTILIAELKKGMDKNNISVALPIANDRCIGEPIIEMMEKMSLFIDEYKELKTTWNIINSSSDLNDNHDK